MRASRLLLCLSALLSFFACDPAPPVSPDSKLRPAGTEKAQASKWIQLFDGESLQGWTPKMVGLAAGEDPRKTFRVVDGALRVSYENYETFDGHFGHLFFEREFGNYRLEFEYRFFGTQCPGGPGWAFRNSGIMIHGQSLASMGKDQDFPASIEVQLLGGNGRDARPTMNLCSPGTHVVMDEELLTRHCLDSKSKTFHHDRWIRAAIEVRGHGSIKHFVDGELVLEYEQAQLDPKSKEAKPLLAARKGDLALQSGTISLQAESHPCEFRRLRLKVLGD